MSIAYLNGQFLPLEEARISPMDRGFLFGDGIYEVIPSYGGKIVGGRLHCERLTNGLDAIGISLQSEQSEWLDIVQRLIDANRLAFPSLNIGVYLHISRGTDTKRFHAFPDNISPTVFAFAFEIPPSNKADKTSVQGLKVHTAQDLRWRRCHIKSTSLLGNVLHFQQGQDTGVNETILFNEDGYVTEASVCNVFAVKGNTIMTPALDHQLLPGITRHIVLESLHTLSSYNVEERNISIDELKSADEVWLTSSSKEIAPVTEIDGEAVGSGKVGSVWEAALAAYHSHKFNA